MEIKMFDDIIKDMEHQKLRIDSIELQSWLDEQIEALKQFKKEVIDFRIIKSILK